MNNLRTIFTSITAVLLFIACSDDNDDDAPVVLDAGTLSGGPFEFVVDGTPDMVSGISLTGFSGSGDEQSFVITDDAKNILGLPGTIEMVEAVDFDAAATGSCYIYHITYQTGLTGLEMGMNLDNLTGEYDLSNFITVVRNEPAQANFTVTIENVGTAKDYFSSGTIDGLTMPGDEVSFTFNAAPGHYLSFATMFVQTNDGFLAPSENGFALYDMDGNAITGDVTDSIDLWDAGTEVNEEPGVGANQAPRQSGPDTGMVENGVVKLISDSGDGYTYPMVAETAEVTLTHDGGTEFTLTINNISDMSTLPTPYSPGVWVVHGADQTPLFEVGMAASAGIEDIAEDGDNTISDMELSENSGLNVPFSPGAYAINEQVFVTGEAATSAFEAIAEDGDPSGYTNAFNTPDGAAGPAPIFFGESYSFSFTAEAGDVLSWATMMIQSNDWVVGGNNIALFENGAPVSGDVTALMAIYDAGTEVDEYPGAGPNQAPRQAGPNTGMDENGVVELENTIPANVPALADMIRITITAN